MIAQYREATASPWVASRQSLSYTSGIICLALVGPAILFDEPRHQVGELEEISHPE